MITLIWWGSVILSRFLEYLWWSIFYKLKQFTNYIAESVYQCLFCLGIKDVQQSLLSCSITAFVSEPQYLIQLLKFSSDYKSLLSGLPLQSSLLILFFILISWSWQHLLGHWLSPGQENSSYSRFLQQEEVFYWELETHTAIEALGNKNQDGGFQEICHLLMTHAPRCSCQRKILLSLFYAID